jgi:VanZ family protein
VTIEEDSLLSVIDAGSAMREFARPRLWLGIWWFGWILCVVLSLIPSPPIPAGVPDGDKIGHMLAYGLLSAWAVMIFRTRRAWLRSAVALLALGIVMEFAQGALTEYRSADPYDALADGVGILLGLAVALTSTSGLLLTLERRWLR